MSLCIAFASGKGGVGKSTVTANLGAALAQRGYRVVIIDSDIGLRSQDALLSLENRIVYDLIDVTSDECSLDQAILASENIPGLYLLPAAQFSRAKKLDPRKFSRIINKLRCSFDYILIDCPAGIERGLRNVLNAGADKVVLLTTPDDISIRSAERARYLIEDKGISDICLVVNYLNEQLIRSGEMIPARTVAEVLDLPLLGEIPEDMTVYRSMLRHQMLVYFDCEARNAFMRIASRIQGKHVPFPAYGSRKKTFPRRLRYKPMKEVSPIDDH